MLSVNFEVFQNNVISPISIDWICYGLAKWKSELFCFVSLKILILQFIIVIISARDLPLFFYLKNALQYANCLDEGKK